MKLRQVTLENFGIYKHKLLDFDAQPLVLIYGPNESGKTTMLNALRQALCGFRDQNPYRFNRRAMKAEVSAFMADRRQLAFSRQKGRPDKIAATLDDTPISEEQLADLICRLELNSYEQLFGFSLDELRSGEAALKNSRLADALAGGGLGGVQVLQQLSSELQQTLADLYRPRATTSSILRLLSRIQGTRQSLRDTQALPAAVHELQAEFQQAREDSESYQQRAVQVRNQLADTDAILHSLADYRKFRAIQRRLEEIDIPPTIDRGFARRWTEIASQRLDRQQRLRNERGQLERESTKLQRLGSPPRVLELANEIERLGYKADQIVDMHQRRTTAQAQLTELQTQCHQLLELLGLAEVSQRIRDFAVSTPQRKRLERLAEQYEQAEQHLQTTRARLEQAREPLAGFADDQTLADMPSDLLPIELRFVDTSSTSPIASPEPSRQAQPTATEHATPNRIDDLAELVQALHAHEQQASSELARLQNLEQDSELRALHKKLVDALGGVNRLDAEWRLPAVRQVREHLDALNACDRERAEVEMSLEGLETQQEHLQAELTELRSAKAGLPIEQAEQVARRRDAILQQWSDELSQPLTAASITVEDQRSRVEDLRRLAGESDRLRAQIVAAADSVANINHKQQQLDSLQQKSSELQQEQSRLSKWQASLASRWTELWQEVSWEPLPPALMLDWLVEFERWREHQPTIEEQRRRADAAGQQVASQRERVRKAWPVAVRADISCKLLLETLEHWRSVVRDAQKSLGQRRVAEQRVEGLLEQQRQIQHQQQELLDQYHAWLRTTPLDDAWPIEQFSKLLDAIESLRRTDTGLQSTEAELQRLGDELERFRQQVTRLAEQLDLQTDIEQPERVAELLLGKLHTAREEQSERIRLSADVDARKSKLAELEREWQEFDTARQRLCAQVECDASQIEEYVERMSEADELSQQASILRVAIESNCRSSSPEAFLQSLDEADDGVLKERHESLVARLDELEQGRKEADQQIGSLKQRIEQLANNEAAQRNRQSLHEQHGELIELSEQWIVRRVAQELLDRSVQRFASENEPSLLRYTRQYLQRLTDGRYRSVEQDSDGGGLLVRNAQQEVCPPSTLSTGTREQLYLALRMAYISHHCEHHEPLPVIMDDCFVNFDDQRMRMALEAINAWDDSLQVLLLTCHRRVLHSLAEFAPNTRVIHLQREAVFTAGEFDSRPDYSRTQVDRESRGRS